MFRNRNHKEGSTEKLKQMSRTKIGQKNKQSFNFHLSMKTQLLFVFGTMKYVCTLWSTQIVATTNCSSRVKPRQ